MARRRIWWVVAAGVLVVTLLVALLTPTAPMPFHFWARPGDPTLRLFETPGGAEIRGFALTAIRSEVAHLSSIGVVREPSLLDRIRARLGADLPERQWLQAEPLAVARTDGWQEFGGIDGAWPTDAVPDPACAGDWEVSSQEGAKYVLTLRPDGTLEAPSGVQGGRWARVGDVLVFGANQFIEPIAILDSSGRSFRIAYGWTGTKLR